MANFRIDEMCFQLNPANGNYSLEGICNRDDGTTGIYSSTPVTGNLVTFDEVVFNVGMAASSEKIKFNIPYILDFSNFPDETTDFLTINFYNNAVGKRPKGGIVIKDTNYPPPIEKSYRDYEEFVRRFTIGKLRFSRIGTTEAFEIEATLLVDNSEFEYSVDPGLKLEYISKTKTGYSEIILLRAKEWPLGSGPGGTSLVFTANDASKNQVKLGRHPKGMAVLIGKLGDAWSEEFNRKKFVVFTS